MPNKIKGVYAAAATPLRADGTVDTDKLVRHCLDLLDRGCHGIGLLGTTGEANSFSVDERKAILEATIAGGIPPAAILLGSGAAAISDAIALTRHGVAAGVTDFLVLPPFYYKNLTEDGVFAYFSGVIEAANDPRLRVVLYHIPQFSAVPITKGLLDRLVARFPETIAGVKDSSGDIETAYGFARNHPDLGLMVGSDQFMLPLLREGGSGCITGLANIVSEDLRLIYDRWTDSGAAAAVNAAQARLEALRKLSATLPAISGMKAVMAQHFGDEAWRRTRPPLVPASAADAARVRAALPEALAAKAA